MAPLLRTETIKLHLYKLHKKNAKKNLKKAPLLLTELKTEIIRLYLYEL